LSSVPKATAQPDVSFSRVTNTADDVKPHKANVKAHSSSEHDMNRADDFKTDTYSGEFRHKLGVYTIKSNSSCKGLKIRLCCPLTLYTGIRVLCPLMNVFDCRHNKVIIPS